MTQAIAGSSGTSAKPRPPRYFPGLAGQIVIAFCLILIVLSRLLQYPWLDTATRNIVLAAGIAITLLTIFLWYCFRSDYGRLPRRIVLFGTLGIIALLIGLFRYEGVDGNMVLRFVPRWQGIRDRQLGRLQPVPKGMKVDLATTTPDDFPQFLGPYRMPYVPRELNPDWKANPPKLLWKRPIGAGWSAFSAVNGFAVTMEQRGDEEWVTCYEIATGRPAWGHAIEARHQNPLGGIGPRSTPTIHSGRVYALGATGVLRCLDGNTGKLLWDEDLLERYGLNQAEDGLLVQWGRSGSPLIVDDMVVVPAGGPAGKAKSLAAFDAESGEFRWDAGNSQVSYASPTLTGVGGVRHILIVNEASVSGHDPANGRLLWEHPWPGSSTTNANASQAVVLPGHRVLLTKGYGGGAECLQITGGSGQLKAETVWKSNRVLLTKFTNVTVIDGFVYGLSDGILQCVDPEDGRSEWKKGRYGHGQILGVGRLILVVTEKTGELVLVEATPEGHVELGRIKALDGITWNNLCLCGKKLLVRNGEEAACFELQ